MKNRLAIFAALLLCSCAKNAGEPAPALMDYSISVSAPVKSTFVSGESAVSWTRGDRIAVFDGTACRVFTSDRTSSEAVFIGQISSNATSLTLVYPYSADVTEDLAAAADLIPAVQWAKAGGFADDASVAVGSASVGDSSVELQNVCGYAKLTLPAVQTGISRIDFTSAAANASLYASGEEMASGDYYFCLKPAVIPSFTVTLHRTDGKKASFGSSKQNTIPLNAVLNLGTVPSQSLEWEDETLAETFDITLDFSNGAWPFDTASGSEAYPETSKDYVLSGNGSYLYSVSGRNVFDGDFSVGPNGSLRLPAVPGAVLSAVRVVSTTASSPCFFEDASGARVSAVTDGDASTDSFYRIAGAEAEKPVFLRNWTEANATTLTLTYAATSADRLEVTSVAAVTDPQQAVSFTFEGGSASDYVTGFENGRPYARPASCGSECNFYGPAYYEDGERLILNIDFKSTCSLTDFPTVKQNSAVPETEYTISGTSYKISLGCYGSDSRYLYRNSNHLHCNYLRAKFPVIDGYRLSRVEFVQAVRNCSGEYLFGLGDSYNDLGASNYRSGVTENQYYYLPSGIDPSVRVCCMSNHILQIDAIKLEYLKAL